jgi:hypothetical protein
MQADADLVDRSGCHAAPLLPLTLRILDRRHRGRIQPKVVERLYGYPANGQLDVDRCRPACAPLDLHADRLLAIIRLRRSEGAAARPELAFSTLVGALTAKSLQDKSKWDV